MQYTPHYRLPLFESADHPSWLGDWNETMNKIDEAISDLEIGNIPSLAGLIERIVALENAVSSDELIMSTIELCFASRFSSSLTYSKGDFVVYEHSLYEYSDPIPSSGEFDGTKWSLRQVGDLFNEINTQIATLITTVGDSASGLVKDVSDLQTAVTALSQGITVDQTTHSFADYARAYVEKHQTNLSNNQIATDIITYYDGGWDSLPINANASGSYAGLHRGAGWYQIYVGSYANSGEINGHTIEPVDVGQTEFSIAYPLYIDISRKVGSIPDEWMPDRYMDVEVTERIVDLNANNTGFLSSPFYLGADDRATISIAGGNYYAHKANGYAGIEVYVRKYADI